MRNEFQTTASGSLPANPPTRGNDNSTPPLRARQAEELLVRAGRLRPTSEEFANVTVEFRASIGAKKPVTVVAHSGNDKLALYRVAS